MRKRDQIWKRLADNLCEDLGIPQDLNSVGNQFSNEFEEAEAGDESELLQKSIRRPRLFTYQEELVNQVLSTQPIEGGLLALPTGAGKTRTALAICLEGLANNSLHMIIWLATTMELIDQAYETTKSLYENHGGLDTLFLSKNLQDFRLGTENPTIIFTTPQAIYADFKKENVISQRPDLVVFDEAHQAIASSYTAGLSHLGCFDLNSPTPLLGLSATPGRGTESETEDLVNMFQERLLTAPSLT